MKKEKRRRNRKGLTLILGFLLAAALFAAVFHSGFVRRIQEDPSPPEIVRELTLSDTSTKEEVEELLRKNPALEVIRWEGCPFTPEECEELLKGYPDCFFDWTLPLGKGSVKSRIRELDYSTQKRDFAALCGLLRCLYPVEKVELGDWEPRQEEAEELAERFPDTLFRYDGSLLGVPCSTDAETVDLSGTKLTDTEELERELIRFPKLRKVDMCDCGLDNETMAALNDRHETVNFIWEVTVRSWRVRTDATYFISFNAEKAKGGANRSFENLRYCKDLVAVDLGHYAMKNAELEFLYSTPHIRYLILAITHVSDITAVGSLKELEYLELFFTDFSDITPLENCHKLKHLNICHCYNLKDDCIESLCRMTQLERLWFYDYHLSRNFLPELQAALPNCEIQHSHASQYTSATGKGWREHEAYYEMRDAFEMFYLE